MLRRLIYTVVAGAMAALSGWSAVITSGTVSSTATLSPTSIQYLNTVTISGGNFSITMNDFNAQPLFPAYPGGLNTCFQTPTCTYDFSQTGTANGSGSSGYTMSVTYNGITYADSGGPNPYTLLMTLA